MLQFVPLRASESTPSFAAPGPSIKPSRHLVRQALQLAGDECAVSVWQRGAATIEVGQSVIASGAKWAMCIAISLSAQEHFALYATGAHLLPGEQLDEVQRLFAALGAIAKQHLLAARAKERQGQIGQFFGGLFTAHGRNRTCLSKYAVIGRAVNQAARLETLTKKFGVPILVDGALALALASEKLLLRRIGRLRPAGMQDVIHKKNSSRNKIFLLCF